MMLSPAEIADRCDVSVKTVRRAILRGELPAVKVFGRVRVDERDLNAYIESGRVGGRDVPARSRISVSRASASGSLRALDKKTSKSTYGR